MSTTFADDTARLSYALGLNMAEYLTGIPLPIDEKTVLEGISEGLARHPRMTPEEYAETMQKLQHMMQEASKQAKERLSAANIAAEKEFLAANGKKPGVKTTASGLQYEVLKKGSGNNPTLGSQVKVHYTGTLLDGTVFDSSVQRGEPASFGVSQVIAGWSEALQLMNAGAKFKLYIPSKLAYGSRGAGSMIQPDTMLIFEVELLEILA